MFCYQSLQVNDLPGGNLFSPLNMLLSSDLQDLVDWVDGVHGVADAVVVHQGID